MRLKRKESLFDKFDEIKRAIELLTLDNENTLASANDDAFKNSYYNASAEARIIIKEYNDSIRSNVSSSNSRIRTRSLLRYSDDEREQFNVWSIIRK